MHSIALYTEIHASFMLCSLLCIRLHIFGCDRGTFVIYCHWFAAMTEQHAWSGGNCHYVAIYKLMVGRIYSIVRTRNETGEFTLRELLVAMRCGLYLNIYYVHLTFTKWKTSKSLRRFSKTTMRKTSSSLSAPRQAQCAAQFSCCFKTCHFYDNYRIA